MYQRVRLDKLQNELRLKRLEGYQRMLQKLIEASERGEMIGAWHDYGRLLDY